MPLLAVERLVKRFGPIAALAGVDLDVAAGEIFVLLGGSGSGKTTLLRCIAGFERPDGGRILLDGDDLGGLPAHRRPVNTMFQSYALFPHMSVAANIAFGLRQQRLGSREIEARVREMLELVQLEGFGARRPDALSGGQKQRVALARALARRPRLLLLDEPLSALDRGLREQTRAELVGVQRRLGATFILVTHDQEEAMSMASRIGVMREGRIEQVGLPADIYERPASRFVAEFVGAANVLPARVCATGTDATLVEIAGLGRVRVAQSRPDAAFLAIRPERVVLGPASENAFVGVIGRSTYRGDALTCTAELGPHTIRVSLPLSAGAAAGRIGAGEAVTVSFPPAACILLAE